MVKRPKMRPVKTRNVHVRCSQPWRAWLERLADQDGKTISEWIEEAVREKASRDGKAQPPTRR